ncbi:MAG: helix-turn-helix transcriptional regulator [Candidatus Bathyarchaeia archaeon]|nr:helix-turn-helix transcriptional regulator [Candidatus Bathyarchaeota archaeon]
MSAEKFEDTISDFSRFYILIILYESPSHGYAIIEKFRTRLGKDITPSLVYPFLRDLERRGLIRHIEKPVGKKKRKIYELTERGNQFCKRIFKRFATIISAALEPNLLVCTNCGCKILEGGHYEVIDGKKVAFCCSHCAASYKKGL